MKGKKMKKKEEEEKKKTTGEGKGREGKLIVYVLILNFHSL